MKGKAIVFSLFGIVAVLYYPTLLTAFLLIGFILVVTMGITYSVGSATSFESDRKSKDDTTDQEVFRTRSWGHLN
jgi:predicted membrane channel-forming protein YqfA (hemolysin III family)